ncbi:DHA2 family efflux MFS transporter permease subunit [Fictibacillus phosphorivorans]|uniref:DHA2 family efflux MFS transporter permease subunit n=1 Tax=Fictibacillus phosphorivorans TaxID=1221500 RepID=UPI0020407427|nr:DHA2 family efflux MFS transporter permease subunit [Fictibacillus phosphorivorans]MCM3717822.1 DHA2 family efflux MFS transporter permease subunit [Fictibacillus phosphorivorans]MCM3777050.1 DHA2 family efflux MFS transporter permease subunit [Fictibacillus phosphorivorans]
MEATQNYKQSTIVTLLLAGTFIAILNQTLMITAIPPIMEEMKITANSAQWLTTVFMLVNGIMIPVSAFLLERFTTRQLFLSAMSVFAFGTLVAGLAPNFEMLLLGRVIQSSGAGVMLPLMQTVFLMIFPVNKRGSAMGLVGLVISFAPAIGPALSGWVTSHYSWRLLFFIILPIAIIDIVIAYFALKNVTETAKTRVDVLSIILSSFGFGGLLYGFTCAGNLGWTASSTLLWLAIGVVALVIFIIRQLRLKHPMLEFRVFANSVFPLTVAIGMITFMGLIGAETIIPLFMQNMRDFTAFEAGLALLPGALITGLLSPITGRLFDKFGARWLAFTGLTIITGSSFAFATLSPSTSFTFITVMYSIRMLGLGMVMMPVATAGLNRLPKRLIPHGAAMDNTMKMIAASVGTAILVTVMTTVANNAENNPEVSYPDMYGANMAFIVVAVLSLLGLITSFFIKNEKAEEESAES